MSETAPSIKKVTVADLDPDFANSALFREIRKIAQGNVKFADRTGTRIIQGERVPVAKNDAIIIRGSNDRYHLERADFDRRYENHPTDPAYFRSKDTGRAIWMIEDVIFIDDQGNQHPIKAGGAVFKSDIDGAVRPYQQAEFTSDFARQLYDGSLVELSRSFPAQTIAIGRIGDHVHLLDLGLERLAASGRQIGDVTQRMADASVDTLGVVVAEAQPLLREVAADAQVIARGLFRRARSGLGHLFGDQPHPPEGPPNHGRGPKPPDDHP